jgi:hypothetical protein
MATSQSNNTPSTLSTTPETAKTLGNVTIIAPSKKIPTDQSSSSNNIASLINSDTLSTLKSIKDPKSFGDQFKDVAKQKAIEAVTNSTLFKLKKRQADLFKEGVELDIRHQITLQKIEFDHTPKKQVQNGETVDIPPFLNDEEYQQAINTENKNYTEAKDNLQKGSKDL